MIDYSESHIHKAAMITLCGKVDSFVIECPCGEQLSVGTWFLNPPKGWDSESWLMTLVAGILLLQQNFEKVPYPHDLENVIGWVYHWRHYQFDTYAAKMRRTKEDVNDRGSAT